MSKLVPLLLVLLIAGVGWQVVETSSLRSDMQRLDDDATTLQATLSDLERRVRRLSGHVPEPGLRGAEAGALAAEPSADDDGPRLLPRGADPAVIARAVRDLQSRVSEQESRVEGVERQVEKSGSARNRFHFQRPIRRLEEAQTRLDLSSAQRADIERILDYAKRDLEDLKSLPNADGNTWKDVTTPTTTTNEGGFTVVMTNMADTMKFRRSRMPGSTETYGEADQRIRSRARNEVREVLNPEQQKTWDESPANDLLGGSGLGSGMVSFTATALSPPAVRED